MAQLEGWNRARQMAVDVLEAYSDADRSIEGVVSEWNGAVLNHLNELKQTISRVLFKNPSDSVDELARVIMNAEGWWRTHQ